MTQKPQIYSIEQLKSFVSNFIEESMLGKQNKESTIGFHQVPFSYQSLTKDGEVFQTIVIGGSILERGLAKNISGVPEILEYSRTSLPIISSKQILMGLIESNIYPDVEVLSLNFAYPVEYVYRDGRMDAKMITGAKQHKFEGLIGKNVGEEIEKYFAQKSRNIKVNVANDTVCLCAATLNYFDADTAVAGIVGTGVNFAYMAGKTTVVNLESGNFGKLEQSSTGKIIDKNSTTPGKFFLEKEVSGAYLFWHYNLWLDNLGLSYPKIKDTLQLDELVRNGDGTQSSLARVVMERSSQLVAMKIVSIFKLKNAEKLDIVMEGSLFWNALGYLDNVYKYIELLGVNKEKINFKKVEKSSTIGAAKVVC